MLNEGELHAVNRGIMVHDHASGLKHGCRIAGIQIELINTFQPKTVHNSRIAGPLHIIITTGNIGPDRHSAERINDHDGRLSCFIRIKERPVPAWRPLDISGAGHGITQLCLLYALDILQPQRACSRIPFDDPHALLKQIRRDLILRR